jgi:hypothetical protein
MSKIAALAAFFKISEEQISEEYSNVYSCETESGEYLVLTDSEAEKAWDEWLDNYLEECVLCELPEIAKNYFDSEKWKR